MGLEYIRTSTIFVFEESRSAFHKVRNSYPGGVP